MEDESAPIMKNCPICNAENPDLEFLGGVTCILNCDNCGEIPYFFVEQDRYEYLEDIEIQMKYIRDLFLHQTTHFTEIKAMFNKFANKSEDMRKKRERRER